MTVVVLSLRRNVLTNIFFFCYRRIFVKYSGAVVFRLNLSSKKFICESF